MAEEPVRNLREQRRKYDWSDVVMLLIIMGSLLSIFLVGVWITVGKTGFTSSSDVVAVISPALAAIGTVAAGVFGYSLGSRGTADAQQVANLAGQQTAVARQDAAAVAADAGPWPVVSAGSLTRPKSAPNRSPANET